MVFIRVLLFFLACESSATTGIFPHDPVLQTVSDSIIVDYGNTHACAIVQLPVSREWRKTMSSKPNSKP